MKTINEFLKNINLEGKLLIVYVIALSVMDFYAFSFKGRNVLYVDILFLLMFSIVVFKLIVKSQTLIVSPLSGALGAMVLMFMISFLNSTKLVDSVAELCGLIYLIVLFMLLPNIVRTRKMLINILYAWIIAAAIVSVIGIFAFLVFVIKGDTQGNTFLFYTTIESMAHHFPRIDSTYMNANMFLTYLHVSLIFCVILFLLEKSIKKKRIIIAFMFTMLVTAFFTGSRRFTGLILSGFIVLCLYGKGKFFSISKYVVFLGFLFFLIISIVTSIWVIFPVDIVKSDSSKTLNITIHKSYSLHFVQPIVSLSMFKAHPVLGVGFGTYNEHFKEYVNWEWLENSFGYEAYPEVIETVKDKTLNYDPHSAFLGVLAETGIAGFFGLMFFLIKYILMLLKRLLSVDRKSFESILAGCVLAGFLGFLLNGAITDILSMRHFWFLMAIGLLYPNLKESNVAC